MGLGVGLTSVDVALMSPIFNSAQREQPARVPQIMKKTGTTALLDDDGNAVMDSRGRARMADVITAVEPILARYRAIEYV
jgi:hypothetical protein